MSVESEYEISPTGWVRDQTKKIVETGTTTSVDIKGSPVVLITMRGAKSCKLRKVPLMRVDHDGVYAIVSSLGGAPQNPVWYNNVVAHPDVELQDGTESGRYTAREVTGEEKAIWWERAVVRFHGRDLAAWERAVAAYPDYADYQKRTTREIPVFVLEPAQG